MAAACATETEAFLSLARQRLATEGWTAGDWVETGLRQALLQDGRRLMEGLLNDPTLPLPDDANHRAGNAPAGRLAKPQCFPLRGRFSMIFQFDVQPRLQTTDCWPKRLGGRILAARRTIHRRSV